MTALPWLVVEDQHMVTVSRLGFLRHEASCSCGEWSQSACTHAAATIAGGRHLAFEAHVADVLDGQDNTPISYWPTDAHAEIHVEQIHRGVHTWWEATCLDCGAQAGGCMWEAEAVEWAEAHRVESAR